MTAPVVEEVDNYLDIFGQQPGIQIYTQISLCFPVADESSHPAIIGRLTKGLERLTVSFPWIAGQVVNEGSGEGNSGVFKIKPLEKTPRLVVKDFRDDSFMPTMDDYRRANFPFSMLDENIIAPENTIPASFESRPAPIFLLQANFITGGLLLTVVALHSVMDMVGQGHIIHLLSKACNDEPFTDEELSIGNLARRNIIPLLDEAFEPSPELLNRISIPPPSQPTSGDSKDPAPPPPPPPKATWAYISFRPASLKALKSLATKDIHIPSGYVSTDDALSTFIWQSVGRARLPRLSPTTNSIFARAVDTRRYLGLPSTYTGLVQNMTYTKTTLGKLVEEPLGMIASQLRIAVDPKTSTLGQDTRAFATVLARANDKSSVSITAAVDSSVDIMVSSWTKPNLYDLDFNFGLGKPESVRRPRLIDYEGLIYFMPKRLDGEITVGICLRDEDMERLKADEEVLKYGVYIG